MRALAQGDGAEALTTRYQRNLARLACLAPDIQRAILDGAQPVYLTLCRLVTDEPGCTDLQSAAEAAPLARPACGGVFDLIANGQEGLVAERLRSELEIRWLRLRRFGAYFPHHVIQTCAAPLASDIAQAWLEGVRR